MNKSLAWRLALLVVTLVAAVFSLFPLQDKDYMSTFESLAAPKLEALRANKASASVVTEYDAMLKDAKARIAKDKKLQAYSALKLASRGDDEHARFMLNQVISLPGTSTASNETVLQYVRREAAGKFRLGLDLRGGTEFIVGFDAKAVPDGRKVEDVRDQIVEILRNRIDQSGVSEPEIKPVGPTAISVRVPSILEEDKAGIRQQIQQTAKLTFHQVHPESDQLVQTFKTNRAAFEKPAGFDYTEMETVRDGQIVNDGIIIKHRPEAIRGEDLDRAFPTFNQFGAYTISIGFNSKGAKAFGDVSTELTGKRLAIVLDGKVYSAPVIREPILGGNAEISGNFSAEEAKLLAVALQCGNLPVQIGIDSEFGTDPTLGSDSIKSGLTAGIYGTLAVVVFMLVYYLLSGLLAVLALAANTLFLFSAMALMQGTITMPGIAGIVLGIGVAVDSNVLIFERIREELANKKTLGNAIHAGFDRAFATIIDSHMTTLITCLILWMVGSGPVRGFAATLAVGLIANLFTAVFMTRTFYDILLSAGLIKNLKMLHLLRQTNINFLAIRKPAIIVSIAIIVITIGACIFKGKETLSIDFAGGTQITYRYDAKTAAAPDIEAIRKVTTAAGYQDSLRISYKASGATDEKMLEIVIPNTTTTTTTEAKVADPESKLLGVLKTGFPQVKFEQVQTNRVGGLVGKQFQLKALWAILLSWLAIILYVAFRFEFTFGVAAVFGLVHDVIIGIAACILFGRQFSMPVLAALMTIIGYSINDTIVVFDRLRENLGLYKDKKYFDLVNLSVNQTLARTLITTLTAFITVLSLFLFGGGAINDFSLVMLAGMVTGVYSTVFISSALVSVWHKHTAEEDKEAAKVTSGATADKGVEKA